jgi:hypothetical protein
MEEVFSEGCRRSGAQSCSVCLHFLGRYRDEKGAQREWTNGTTSSWPQ